MTELKRKEILGNCGVKEMMSLPKRIEIDEF